MPEVEAPEHEWRAARPLVFPVLRPAGTTGQPAEQPLEPGGSPHGRARPIVTDGPCGLVISFVMAARGFDVLVSGEHLLGWGVDAAAVADAAGANLAAWSAATAWTDEISGHRRILSSESWDRHDAARILLPEVRASLARELCSGDGAERVLVGVPERGLLLAGSLHHGDPEFADLFAAFVAERAEAADEPIGPGVYELVDGELRAYAP